MSSVPCRTRIFGPALQLVERPLGPCEAGLPPDPPTYVIELLPTSVEWQRECEVSGVEEKFVATKSCVFGLIGECTHCGEERIAPFTHTQGVE